MTVAPIHGRTGRAAFATKTVGERREERIAAATPGHGTGRCAADEPATHSRCRATLDRSKSCVKGACGKPAAGISAPDRSGKPDGPAPNRPEKNDILPPGVSADSDTGAQCLTTTSARTDWQRPGGARY
ncbi:hypothetical protein ACVBGC_01255 [Burkholderia stagnalis]